MNYNAGIYIRLSQEDKNKIFKEIILKYLLKQIIEEK